MGGGILVQLDATDTNLLNGLLGGNELPTEEGSMSVAVCDPSSEHYITLWSWGNESFNQRFLIADENSDVAGYFKLKLRNRRPSQWRFQQNIDKTLLMQAIEDVCWNNAFKK